MEISLFGAMRVSVDGRPLPKMRSRKGLWLLALLALREGAPTTRERLAFMLWPDTDPSVALSNLRSVISDLRRALGSQRERLLAPNRETLAFDLRDVAVDALAFDRAIKRHDFAEAVERYRADLLLDCSEEWAVQERRARQEQALAALLTLGDETVRTYPREAAELYRRASAIDPLRDEPVRGLMDALAAVGDVNGALQAYREFARKLSQTVAALPDARTTRLYARLREGNRNGPPNLPAVAGETIGNLPHPLSSLVGREDERDGIAASLRTSRLVTLTGVGGVGKTRLAIAAAGDVRGGFPDGVWFVPLDAISDGAQVGRAVVSALNLGEKAGDLASETLAKGLRSKRALLVLDNCEHLIDACLELCEALLRECGELRLLLTSREPLAVAGECVFAVPGLSVPDSDRLPEGAATRVRVALGYEGVALFVERAHDACRGFVFDASNARAVAEICARLEGIPLAIELAAVKANTMAVDTILARLEDLLRPVAVGQGAPHPRQLTMHAALNWSYELLDVAEQYVLMRLSVFVGGWTPSAAEAVACEETAGETARLLRSLVAKSFVVFDVKAERYRLLEPVRRFAVERLAESGETATAFARHQFWFLRLAEEAEVEGPDAVRWMRTIADEEENLHAAMVRGEAESGLRIGAAIFRFWYVRGEFDKGLARLFAVVARGEGDSTARRKALQGIASMHYCQRSFPEAQRAALEAFEMAERLEDGLGSALAVHLLALVAHGGEDLPEKRRRGEQCLRMFRALGFRRGVAVSLTMIGNDHVERGDYALARPLFAEVLEIAQADGDLSQTTILRLCLGNLESLVGNDAAAKSHFEDAVRLQEEIASPRGVAMGLHGLCRTYARLGRWETARDHGSRALELFREVGDRHYEGGVLCDLAELDAWALDLPSARNAIERSLELSREFKDRTGMARALRVRAKVERLGNELKGAERAIVECLSLVEQGGDPQTVVEALEELGSILLAKGVPMHAARAWGAGGALRRNLGTPLPPGRGEEMRRAFERAEASLGPDEFQRATREGESLEWTSIVASPS